jgi:hypothetical protein
MIEMLIALLMTAVDKTCLVPAEHPLVVEAQELATEHEMSGVVVLAWTSDISEECQLLFAPDRRPAGEDAKAAINDLYEWWNSE